MASLPYALSVNAVINVKPKRGCCQAYHKNLTLRLVLMIVSDIQNEGDLTLLRGILVILTHHQGRDYYTL